MDANEIIEAIRTAKKKTPVKAYIKASRPLHFENCHVFTGADTVVIGDYEDIAPVIERNSDAIEDMVIENDCRNSALPLLDIKRSTRALSRARLSATGWKSATARSS